MQLIYQISILWLSFTTTIFARILIEDPSTDNSNECDCYLTSGPDRGYFQYHRFFDFRNIPSDGDNDFTAVPELVTDSDNSGNEPVTSSYFNSDSWQSNWAIQAWSSNTSDELVEKVTSPRNVYISRNTTDGAESSTYLTLRTYRLPDFQSTAEIDSNQRNLWHSSIRARLRVIPNNLLSNAEDNSNSSHPVDNGAVVGLFTYESDTAESDIEILTNDPITNIHYSNQPDYDAKTDSTVSGATNNVEMPDGQVWTEWLEHRIDWLPGVSRWYVNDELVLNKTKNVPKKPSGLILNVWSDGGQWSGNMTIGDQVVVGVEWIQMVFNISGDVEGPNGNSKSRRSQGGSDRTCHVGCWIDGDKVKEVGFPVVAFNSTSNGFSIFRQHDSGGFSLAVGLSVIFAIYSIIL